MRVTTCKIKNPSKGGDDIVLISKDIVELRKSILEAYIQNYGDDATKDDETLTTDDSKSSIFDYWKNKYKNRFPGSI